MPGSCAGSAGPRGRRRARRRARAGGGDPRLRRSDRRRSRSSAWGSWSSREGARDRRDRPAAPVPLPHERVLPLHPADADHPPARRRLRRLGPRQDRRRRRHRRTAGPDALARARAQPSVRVDRYSSEGDLRARGRARARRGRRRDPGRLRRRRARRAGRPAALLRPPRLDRAAAPRDDRVDGRRPERPARRRPARPPRARDAVRGGARACARPPRRRCPPYGVRLSAPDGTAYPESRGRYSRRREHPAPAVHLPHLADRVGEADRDAAARRRAAHALHAHLGADDPRRPDARPARGRAPPGADHRGRLLALLRRRLGRVRPGRRRS